MDFNWGNLVFCLCILCVAFHPTAHAQKATPELTGPVVDNAGILSDETERQIASLIHTHEDSTSNQVAVLTISSLEGENLEDYSLQVARAWELGQTDKNNGVLVLIAVNDRKIRIEVGYGLEGDLPDITAKQIIDNEITPHFRAGDFDAGVLLGVRAVLESIEGTYEPASAAQFADSFALRLKAGALLMCFPLFFLGLSIFRSRIAFWLTTAFVSPIMFMAGFVVYPPFGGFIWVGIVIVFLITIRTLMRRSSTWGPALESIAKAKPGDTVPINIGPISWSYRIPKPSSGGSSSGGYSGSSGFSSSSSYSGGGGSFGGGGASGGW